MDEENEDDEVINRQKFQTKSNQNKRTLRLMPRLRAHTYCQHNVVNKLRPIIYAEHIENLRTKTHEANNENHEPEVTAAQAFCRKPECRNHKTNFAETSQKQLMLEPRRERESQPQTHFALIAPTALK